MRARWLAAPLLAWLAWPVSVARAEITKGECIDANTSGQHLRFDHKLGAAREQLLRCTSPRCPGLVRNDCAALLAEVEKVQPTIVLDVRDSAGRPMTGVRITVDGRTLPGPLDGTPLVLDPGAHELVFDAGEIHAKQTLTLVEGVKGRRERIDLVTAPPPPPPAPAPIPPPPLPPPAAPAPEATTSSSGLGTQRILGLALGGAGVAGLAIGGVFGLLSGSAWGNAKSACGGNASQCTNVASGSSYRSTAETDATVSTAGFIAGGALLATGAVLFFTGGSQERGASTGVSLVPSLAPGQTGLAIHGVF